MFEKSSPDESARGGSGTVGGPIVRVGASPPPGGGGGPVMTAPVLAHHHHHTISTIDISHIALRPPNATNI